MKSRVRLAIALGATASIIGLAAPSSFATTAGTSQGASMAAQGVTTSAYNWHCKGKTIIRCIQRSGGYLSSQVKNPTSKAIKGELGVTFSKPNGEQWVKSLRKEGKLAARSGYSSVLYKCPRGYTTAATWWISSASGNPYWSPRISCK
ncbi:hypothetical protein NE236_30550 [Actinoallomurus purpureus]|uniref:hypothetical protein n=1 Tax=Actinoallomurus purpureus TaxID=478114 RepID=UPI002093267F|nr:hypothetical protein [Actinoallomurus purpureus]MCO6009321.1 hypothetical protein [Actinoallomurus purpureus]